MLKNFKPQNKENQIVTRKCRSPRVAWLSVERSFGHHRRKDDQSNKVDEEVVEQLDPTLNFDAEEP